MSGARNLFGVIGHPIGHSLSPAMHNAVFREAGLSYKYEAYDVRPEDLGPFIESCRASEYAGLNVTIPHKVAVMRHLDNISENAQLIGAVNTVKFDGSDACGYNTDGLGCVRALADAGVQIDEKKILVLGAGGAARAIAFQCIIDGAHVCLANRTRKRAEELASDIKKRMGKKIRIVDYSQDALMEELGDIDVLINATSVGMDHKTEEEAIPWERLSSNVTVMDIVYSPLETTLLRKARTRGCGTINGACMLVHQGAESLRIWLGIDPPIKVMEDAVLRRLAGR